MSSERSMRKLIGKDLRIARQQQIANLIVSDKNRERQLYLTMVAKGSQWHSKGMKLEDAPYDLSSNHAFVEGYNSRANRIKLINDSLYELGQLHYITEGDFYAKYMDNEYYMQGFNDAKAGILCDNIKKKRPKQ